ncbi:NUMOD4 motif-containing HNH endonuclease [Salinibacter grassmerensis]|uniref:NUMOD4 motif-containing HNH endonuclease n=1 Tax=Salinibacter grassmerensis TaxID=3040353 RepID=UPI0021E80A41|nr:NUMOD4 motif-containing HNH endonuclease [Salinibacter grassmerensis]
MANWKDIDGFNHKISDDGRVWSKHSGRELKVQTNQNNGYRIIRISSDGQGKTFNVHRLVMENFGPEQPSEDHEVDHIDEDKSNNDINNLQWVTRKENVRRSSKYSVEELNDMKREVRNTEQTSGEVAEKYGATKSVVRKLSCGIYQNRN